MIDDYFKLPRLFTQHAFHSKGVIPLDSGQAHYLHNVLRRKDGDFIRLFNGKDGEWFGKLQSLNKKSGTVVLTDQLKKQPLQKKRLHLVFAPIKKNRMDWLIEKAVELGVSDFHPVLTQNTEIRKLNEVRLQQQIFEAAEQCERLEIPNLHPLQKLETVLGSWPEESQLLACIERAQTQMLQDVKLEKNDIAFIIGPEGGFTAEEKERISKKAHPVSLGETILRCETAVVKALVLINS